MDASTRTTLHSCGYILIMYSVVSLSFLLRRSLLLCPIMARYSSVLPDPACVQRPWLPPFITDPLQVTLQTRIYALYGGSKIILALMVFGYVCEIAALLTIFSFIDADSKSTSAFPISFYPFMLDEFMGYLFGNVVSNELLTGLYICANMQGPSFYHPYVIWVPVVVYDAILCILAVWRGASIWMSGYRAKRLDGVYITDILVKDNAGYFVWYACSP
jgi:hypothetical protein